MVTARGNGSISQTKATLWQSYADSLISRTALEACASRANRTPYLYFIRADSSVVEHLAFNQGVVGSIPIRRTIIGV